MSALWWIRIRGLCKLPDGRGWLWIKLGLALVGKAMLSKSLIQFSAMYGAVFPPCSLIWGQTIVGIIMTSSKRTYARTPGLQGPLLSVPLTPWQATVNPCLCWRLPKTHRQVWLNVLWIHCSFLPSPAVHKVLFVVFQESLSPELWKFCNQIPLNFKVRCPGDSQSLCQIPRLGSLLWGLDLSQQWEIFFGTFFLQFVDSPPVVL